MNFYSSPHSYVGNKIVTFEKRTVHSTVKTNEAITMVEEVQNRFHDWNHFRIKGEIRLRHKNQIWNYFIKYTDEYDIMKYRKEQGSDNSINAFYDMTDLVFYRLLNTFRWLTKYSLSHMRIEEPMTKPTNAEILEAILVMETDGENLMAHAKKHPKGDLRNDLIKVAKSRIGCANYYIQLVEEDYFMDKSIITN